MVRLTLSPQQAATLLYCLRKQAIATDARTIESFAIERNQLLEGFTPEQLSKQLINEELNLVTQYQEKMATKEDCSHLQQLLAQSPRSLRKKGCKVGRNRVTFDGETKKSRHFTLTPTAIKWLDEIASSHQINRNGVIELWARGEIAMSPALANPHAITTVRTNPRSRREEQLGYEFGERKTATNIQLTNTAINWLKILATTRKINRSDLINLWAIGAEQLPSSEHLSSA